MKKKIAVIGAGIAGLACAYELQKAGHEVIVYEKEGQVGGRMASRVKEGFVFDIGADHLCDLYGSMQAYCEEFGIVWEKMRFLKYGVVRDGNIRPMKDVIGTLSKIRVALHSLFIGNLGDFFNLTNLAAHDDEDAYAFMRRLAGREVSDYIVDAFASTYQFHRAEEMSRGALLGIMRSIQKDQEHWYLHRTKGGMQALPDAFAARLNVQLNHPIMAVEGGARVMVDGNAFDAAVLASQATKTRAYYKNPTQRQRSILETTRYAATISLAFRVDRNALPDTAIVWVPFVESHKISGYVNEAMKGEDLVRGGKSLLCVWLHEDFAKTLLTKDAPQIFAAVKRELLCVCPWFASVDELENFDLQRWHEAMPKFFHGHLKAVKTFMEGPGQGEQNVFLCGDYLNSLWTEGALRCGERVAKQVDASF